MAISLQLGLDIIRSYKRLAYSPWHALAEFVDNSSQSYFENRAQLDEAFKREERSLEVHVVYDRQAGMIRVADNAMGMSRAELEHALHVGARPADTSGRSKFGMGLKTAACWYGNRWTVRTKKLGEPSAHMVTVDVEQVADGANEVPYEEIPDRSPEEHYTVIEIHDLNRDLRGRTISKIREFLSSMYRNDLREGILTLTWQSEALSWPGADEDMFFQARDGTRYRKDFEFEVNGKQVWGWVGILDRGSRAKAGFSILHAARVVKGWPDSWRPESIYGQVQGSNDLVNQRVMGEINLDDFDVTHTKDDILWLGTDEWDVQRALADVCADYVAVAKTRRRKDEDERGPSDLEIEMAVEGLQEELTSEEMVDAIEIEQVPPESVVQEGFRALIESIDPLAPTFRAAIGDIEVVGFLATESSSNDPYVLAESTNQYRVQVIINMQHPHVQQLFGSHGVLNYLRHCTYDAIAEWQARHKAARLDPDTIKLLKDRLLRLSLSMEMHEQVAQEEGETAAAGS